MCFGIMCMHDVLMEWCGVAGADWGTPEPPLQVLLGKTQMNTEAEKLKRLDWWLSWWRIRWWMRDELNAWILISTKRVFRSGDRFEASPADSDGKEWSVFSASLLLGSDGRFQRQTHSMPLRKNTKKQAWIFVSIIIARRAMKQAVPPDLWES